MVHLYRLILAFLLAVVSLQASAAIAPVVQYRDILNRVDTVAGTVAWWQAYDPKFACLSPYTPKPATWEARNVTPQKFDLYKVGSKCDGSGTYNDLKMSPTASGSACPLGSALSGGSCQCLSPLVEIGGQCKLPACPVGQHEEGGACVPDACKPNETRVNGVCVPEPPCPTGQTRVNGKCVPMKCPTQGTESDQWYELTSPGTSATCLFNSQDNTYCTMTVKPSVIASRGGTTTYMGGYGVYTGGTCGPSEPGKPTPVDPDKPQGDPDKGTKPPGPNDPKPGDKPGGQPGGPGNNPTPPNPDGSCPSGTYKSGSNCYQKDPPKLPPDNDGKCPAGYIKAGVDCVALMPKPNDADGDGKDDDEQDKDKSSFGGQCEAVTCDGDAIQCAIVRDQYKRACELMEKESAESQLYATNKGKDGNQTGELPGNETISLSGRIDTSDALGGGSCFGDLNITVWREPVTLPLSSLCQYLAMLGNILVAVSLLMAARIVTRG